MIVSEVKRDGTEWARMEKNINPASSGNDKQGENISLLGCL